ncbi:hypothetical protein PHMEG_00020525 [Phytophthora megakarya]|uniref:Reverse transcriptase Ty1/copia-type domain-containing protein n=1 Tax=Phytophthora megakarya TaxID=4795 RepID=A0A225VPT7_9STRA|nr:hypothetical protein PHMEG_00020525 [Phytophthora megakarya]
MYVDDLLVTGMDQRAVDAFFGELKEFSARNVGQASSWGCTSRYNLDQEVMNMEMLKYCGLGARAWGANVH